MPEFEIAVLVTLDSKTEEARFFCDALTRAGVVPWVVDLSLRPHENTWGAVSGGALARAAGAEWLAIADLSRADAAHKMTEGGIRVLTEKFTSGALSGVVGVGGANGSTMACTMMRALPPLFPKAMVTPVAATAAVQWHVAQSDIVMFATIGDISLNRVTRAVMENAARAMAGMAQGWAARDTKPGDLAPLVGVSTFGNVQKSIDRMTGQLTALGFEVMQFHASGPGGKALEHLAARGELAGILDFTTSELTDALTGGVYSAGGTRLTAAGAAGLAQLVVPGSLDFTNWWVGQVPERYRTRAFYRYSVENLLMRTSAEEFAALGETMAERLNAATGPLAILIPARGFSQMTEHTACDLDGKELGPWRDADTERPFIEALKKHLTSGRIEELDLHINDPEFADACVNEFAKLMKDKDQL